MLFKIVAEGIALVHRIMHALANETDGRVGNTPFKQDVLKDEVRWTIVFCRGDGLGDGEQDFACKSRSVKSGGGKRTYVLSSEQYEDRVRLARSLADVQPLEAIPRIVLS